MCLGSLAFEKGEHPEISRTVNYRSELTLILKDPNNPPWSFGLSEDLLKPCFILISTVSA